MFFIITFIETKKSKDVDIDESATDISDASDSVVSNPSKRRRTEKGETTIIDNLMLAYGIT